MKVLVLYSCEICGEEFNTEAGALACEAQGTPELPPFLTLDRPFPTFGENGVHWTTIQKAYVRRSWSTHVLWVTTNPYVSVSHNLEGGSIPVEAFDPRKGWDAFRYSCTAEDLKAWEDAMRNYGFQESEADGYTLDKIRAARRRLAAAQVVIPPAPPPVEEPAPAPEIVEHGNFIPVENLLKHGETAP